MPDLFSFLRSTWSEVFLSPRLYWVLGTIVAIYILSFFFSPLFPLGHALLLVGMLLAVVDAVILFRIPEGLDMYRRVPERFSNGDENQVELALTNRYPFSVTVRVFDEVPVQFQVRDQEYRSTLAAGASTQIPYTLRPVERGEYAFGYLYAWVSSPISALTRRYRGGQPVTIPTYSSFIQMRQYQLMAISNRLTELGVKSIRRLGHSAEFEQIKAYVRGDDFRTLNWKASARVGKLMVNQYTDERAQQVYCLIDKSRTMKMPFDGMRLLDYAINSSLILANIALFKKDKAGLVTFAEQVDTFLGAEDRPIQMQRILEALYKQETRFKEAAMDRLYSVIRRKIPQRSLLVLFTNFESLTSMQRQLPYLQRLAKLHRLVVVFFENTELRNLLQTPPDNTQDLYIQTLGEYFAYEKQQIIRELSRKGILSILTTPENLTVEVLNKYLEIKSRRLI